MSAVKLRGSGVRNALNNSDPRFLPAETFEKSPSPPLRGRCRRQRGGSPSQGLSGRWRRTPLCHSVTSPPARGGEGNHEFFKGLLRGKLPQAEGGLRSACDSSCSEDSSGSSGQGQNAHSLYSVVVSVEEKSSFPRSVAGISPSAEPTLESEELRLRHSLRQIVAFVPSTARYPRQSAGMTEV